MKTFHLTVNNQTLTFQADQVPAMQEALAEAIDQPGKAAHRSTQFGSVEACLTEGASGPGTQVQTFSRQAGDLTDC